jgi:hypothetical protein
MKITVYSANDPCVDTHELFHYVYLHGEAEYACRKVRNDRWNDSADDLCCADVLNGGRDLEDGEYEAILYGEPAIVVIDRKESNFARGRVALLSNSPEVLKHVRTPSEWR